MPARNLWGYLVIWEFRPKAGMEGKFERAYGPDGTWAKFFRKGKGYCGTRLVRDATVPGRYLTFDYWTSRQALKQFRETNLAEYKRIDKLCDEMTQTERELGTFERVQLARGAEG